MVRTRINQKARTQNIVIGIYAMNFPSTPGSTIMGTKTTIEVKTHDITGTA